MARKPLTQKQKKRTSLGQMGAFESYFDLSECSLPDEVLYTGDRSLDPARVAEFLGLYADAKISCLDIETYCPRQSPMGALDPDQGEIRLIQLAFPQQGSPHLCLVHDLLRHDLPRVLHDRILDTLRDRLLSPNHLVVGHNLSFDLTWVFAKFGMRARYVACTMIASQLIYAGLSISHSLGACAARHLKAIDKTEQTSDWGVPHLSLSQVRYAAQDATTTLDLYKALVGLYHKEELSPLVLKAEMGCVPAYAEMNVWGVPIADRPTIEAYIAAYRAAYDSSEAEFLAIFPGCKITESKAGQGRRDPYETEGAPSQLDLGLDYSRDYSLIVAISELYNIPVESLAKSDLAEHADLPGIRSIGACRYLKTVLDYLGNMRDRSRDGRIRGGFTQLSRQGRGRSTSSGQSGLAPGVNVQNPPSLAKVPAYIREFGLPNLRALFTTDPCGDLRFGTNDYSAAHSRIGAQTTGDPAFILSNNDPSVDNHCDVAAAIARLDGQTPAQWTADYIYSIHDDQDHPDSPQASRYRSLAKNCFYGWLNGAGNAKISKEINAASILCDPEQAGRILDVLKLKFPKIAAFHSGVKRYVKDPAVFRHFPGITRSPYAPIWGLDGRRIFLTVSDGDYGLGASPNAAYMGLWMSVESTAKKAALAQVRLQSLAHPEWELRVVIDCHDELAWVCHVDHYETCDRTVWLAMVGSLGAMLPDVKAYKKEWKPSAPKFSWAECK